MSTVKFYNCSRIATIGHDFTIQDFKKNSMQCSDLNSETFNAITH